MHSVDNAAKGPQIARSRWSAIQKHLRGDVIDSPNKCAFDWLWNSGVVSFLICLCLDIVRISEIDLLLLILSYNVQVEVVFDHDVLRFQVSVDHVVLVNELNGRHHLRCVRLHQFTGQFACFVDQMVQWSVTAVLKSEVEIEFVLQLLRVLTWKVCSSFTIFLWCPNLDNMSLSLYTFFALFCLSKWSFPKALIATSLPVSFSLAKYTFPYAPSPMDRMN